MFNENSNIYSKEYEINYYDTDRNLKCKLASIVNFLCDIGNAQAEELGETIDNLVKNNYAWVFYKYDIKVNKYPRYRDKIKVSTGAIGFNRFYAYRGYEIKDAKGEILVEAKALFFCIDIQKRRPARIEKERMDLYSGGYELPKKVNMEEAGKIQEEKYYKEFAIRYSDIDSNGHVNNVKYMEWAIESVPTEIVKDYVLSGIKVTFEKETVYGHSVHVSADVLNNDKNIKTLHEVKDDQGKLLTIIEIDWSSL